jgi:hypothetical protein
MSSPSPQTPPGAERRGSIRYPCDPESFGPDNSCRPITALKDDAWGATLRDVSTGGVGLVVKRRFEPGTLLSLDLQDAEQTASRTVLVRVVRLTREGDDWVLGCAFIHKLTEAELLALLG